MRARPIDRARDAEAPRPGAEAHRPPEGLGARRELLEALSGAGTEEERQVILEKLRQITPERIGRRRGNPVEEVTRALKEAALDTPAPAGPGVVSVRLSGIEDDSTSVPLADLRVRVSSGERSAERRTDETGHALLHLDAAGSASVEVLSPAGEVIERAEVRLSAERSSTVTISVRKRPDLEESFARGRAWSEQMKRRAEGIGARVLADTGALEQRVAAMEATLSRLEEAIVALTKERTKGDDNE